MSSYTVISDYAFDSDGENQVYSLKIQTDNYELNIFVAPKEVDSLAKIKDASWDNRETVSIGKSASSNVFWCVDTNSLSIMVGRDDETWDFSVTLPLQALEDISNSLYLLHKA